MFLDGTLVFVVLAQLRHFRRHYLLQQRSLYSDFLTVVTGLNVRAPV